MQMIDSFSYQCGMIDCLNETAAAGSRRWPSPLP